MIYHKFIVLTLFIVKLTHQTNETEFKPIDNRVGAIINRYIPRPSLTDVLSSKFNQVLDQVENFFDRNLVKEKELELLEYLKLVLDKLDNYNVSKGIQLKRVDDFDDSDNQIDSEDVESSIVENLVQYAKHHVVKVQLYDLVEDVSDKVKRSTNAITASERSFGLKKLMLPFFIGAQILKSVLIAMFLPSILGGIGKLVGKGVSSFASASNGFGHPHNNNMGQMEDFDFKDQNGYESQQNQYPDAQADGSTNMFSYAFPASPYEYNKLQQQNSIGVLPAPAQDLTNRFTSNSQKLSYAPNNNYHGSFYTKDGWKNGKHKDYKVFLPIPSSSLLLTNYDPFYSPLLSRMDSVFKQLGYDTEICRERLVCAMYRNPAKFAPFSNLISAQLSRELNELRKPSTDNPDILRFFKYMKAAKDGQDGLECTKAYPGCVDHREHNSPPMVKTFNEINKLVHARKLST